MSNQDNSPPAPQPSLNAPPDREENGSGYIAGQQTIRALLSTFPQTPGVYRMISEKGDILYVGKAKNLRKRIESYTHIERLSLRIQRMVAQTRHMEVVTTHTEAEALLLEANLIKKLRPRYNILLKDDKSFPYILIESGHDWPRIVKHRGARGARGEYFGPFASAAAVNQTLSWLERAFLLRSCSDSMFQSRTRPCLLYQIKRCSAPCVERVSKQDYNALVDESRRFLSGQSRAILKDMADRMNEAATGLDYEQAAVYRDRIRALSAIQSHQDIATAEPLDADVIALYQAGGEAAIQTFFFRGGCNLGARAFFPAQTRGQEPEEVLAAFLGQFYEDMPPPDAILLNSPLASADQTLLIEALSPKAGRKIAIQVPKRGEKKNLIDHAFNNAREALGRKMAEASAQKALLEGVQALFSLPRPPERIEVYDNSHIQGTNAVGGMIVAGPEGFMKNEYRQFNIKSQDISPGDDFGMMREVLARRFKRALKEDETGAALPDLALIDGGAGQLSAALHVVRELGIEKTAFVAISKGLDREAGRERFHQEGKADFSLPPNDPVLYYLQRLRDEAHRFAIGTHRARRKKAMGASPLDDIEGIGMKRKKALLSHFGSARGVKEAGLADLSSVEGINESLARKIYDHFHGKG